MSHVPLTGGHTVWAHIEVACPAAVKIGAYGDAMFASIAGVASVLRLKVLQDVTLGAGGAGVLTPERHLLQSVCV